jgi:Flp pilus assembly pilin Flp
MRELLNRVIREEEGQDLIEYGLLAAVISISAVATLLLIGQQVDTQYGKITPKLNAVP